MKDLREYLARPERPVALIDRRYWRDFQRELPPDIAVLEKIPIQGKSSISSARARTPGGGSAP